MDKDSKPKNMIGPSLPSDIEKIKAEEIIYTDFKDDYSIRPKRVIGPSRPTTESSSRSRSRSPSNDNLRSKPIVRQSWMTEASIPASATTMDPLNIKARTFIQRKNACSSSDDNSGELNHKNKSKDMEIDEQIKKYNEIHRQKSLQEIHQNEHMEKKKVQTDQDMKERIFDWERDMNSSVRRMSSKSAKDLVNKSNLNDRFGSSSSKKYL